MIASRVAASRGRTPMTKPTPAALSKGKLSSHTLTKKRPVKVSFTISKPSTVTLTLTHKVKGKLRVGIDGWGKAKLESKVRVDGSSIRITLTVSGGVRQVNSVSVVYYAN